MKTWIKAASILVLSVFFFSACATFGPPGPSMPAYIGSGKTQAQYNNDDLGCRNLATARAGDPGQVQQQQAASTFLGMLLGAVAGAAIGGATGGGRGAGIGAAIGGTTGGGVGLGAGTAQAQSDAARLQQRWDVEYHGCMYAAGHQVPGVAAPRQPAPQYAPPPPPPPASLQPSGSVVGPPPAAPAVSCIPTGKYVKTAEGLVPECQ